MITSRNARTLSIQCAWNLKCRKVKKSIRPTCSCVWIANQIRARKIFACSVVIVKKIYVKRTSRTKRDDRIELPTVADARMILTKIWQLIAQGRYKAIADIEIGISTLAFRIIAVVGLRRVCHIVCPSDASSIECDQT